MFKWFLSLHEIRILDELHGLEFGAIDYIRKPFSPALILARVDNQLFQA